MLRKGFRILFALLGVAGGVAFAAGAWEPVQVVLGRQFDFPALWLVLAGGLFGGALGFLIAPWLVALTVAATAWLEHRLHRASVHEIAVGLLGLIVGLIIAMLLAWPFSQVPFIGRYLPLASSLLLGYLGMNVAVRKREELIGLVLAGRRERIAAGSYKLLDTSVIIDGRIADICATGFIEGTLVVPSFVLEELRHIADSGDVLRRNRGRRGLDVLKRLQSEPSVQVQLYERDPGGSAEVDSKLVRLARLLSAKIVTNDFNLNKVAELHGVPVLNINELANSLKPIVLPGEEMTVHVIRDGKEVGQGVAYLDDGTMIVVDGGKKHIGESVGVMVTSVLQTAAGRMIFARPKGAERALES